MGWCERTCAASYFETKRRDFQEISFLVLSRQWGEWSIKTIVYNHPIPPFPTKQETRFLSAGATGWRRFRIWPFAMEKAFTLHPFEYDDPIQRGIWHHEGYPISSIYISIWESDIHLWMTLQTLKLEKQRSDIMGYQMVWSGCISKGQRLLLVSEIPIWSSKSDYYSWSHHCPMILRLRDPNRQAEFSKLQLPLASLGSLQTSLAYRWWGPHGLNRPHWMRWEATFWKLRFRDVTWFRMFLGFTVTDLYWFNILRDYSLLARSLLILVGPEIFPQTTGTPAVTRPMVFEGPK